MTPQSQAYRCRSTLFVFTIQAHISQRCFKWDQSTVTKFGMRCTPLYVEFSKETICNTVQNGGAAGIEFKLNTSVTGADVAAKTLTTEAGDTIHYEKLIIATGCGVRTSLQAQGARERVSKLRGHENTDTLF